jgi:hypothetical protein
MFEVRGSRFEVRENGQLWGIRVLDDSVRDDMGRRVPIRRMGANASPP